ncbi:hypothetical protein FQN54_007581 [Arachnomyces sp. PD_36]|nr:hypothetical protein FQN54_007581 [Arachnomyces sp. PD_36]
MASPKIFLTGATGYIGGDSLAVITKAHPDWDITALVRSKEKGAQVTNNHPNVKLVYGDLDSTGLIEEESKKADIVFHFADCDHVASAEAISRGLRAHSSDRPGYWIHTSGTGILTFEDFRASSYGNYRAKEYNDWDGVGEVTSLPDDALHRNVDKIVLAAGQDFPDRVKTAIVCPPCIYGPGRGPGNTRSAQVYILTKEVLKRKKGIQVGKGENIWHSVHVQDLSDLFLAVGEAAASGDGKATWGDEGYYFAENGPFEWGAIQRSVAESAFQKKLIPSAEPDIFDEAKANSTASAGAYMWGTNSRGYAIRGRKLFGWSPTRPSLKELVPDIVDLEAKTLGLV